MTADRCWICGKTLRTFGIQKQTGCPVHGSRGANPKATPKTQPLTPLRDPDYDFTTEHQQ